MKPFRPPTIIGRSNPDSRSQVGTSEPPSKKRRIIRQDEDHDTESITAAAQFLKKAERISTAQSPRPGTFQPPARRPLVDVQNVRSSQPSESGREDGAQYYSVLWRKPTMKKNKTWDGDGVLMVNGSYAYLKDISGRDLGKGKCNDPLLLGSELSIGGKDVELEDSISRVDFLAGKPFLHSAKPPETSLVKAELGPKVPGKTLAKHERQVQRQTAKPFVGPTLSVKAGFKAPLLEKPFQSNATRNRPVARHDPNAPGALVMKRPSNVPVGKQVVDVVVDPLLTRHLREHQRAGVAFMYECVMGMKRYSRDGAILADEMGLGKTLQTIALLWTLLKQNPIAEDAPIVKKALIVCPVTLINNWRREFKKWLGTDRIGVFVAESKKDRLSNFTMGKMYNVMIIGYEKLRNVQDDLKRGAGIDIVIADEGHRMKTAQNKSALAIKSLNTERRIILSGTPLQNDLAEFYTMVDFVNPGLLNKYSTFKREFENPILKAQQPGASKDDLEKGEARSEELANITSMFILRRTAEILSQYLPTKTEYILYCRPTQAQLAAYRAIIGSPTFSAALGSPAVSLELINILKKVCNSPNLLLKKGEKAEGTILNDVLPYIPQSTLRSPGSSSKLQVLDSLLHQIHTSTDEKVVLVSNYTSTLDMLAGLITSLSYPYLRLDGSTPQSKRQDLVDRFNRSPASNSFIFLLSAKAGGVGLNLIGASRMILFDLDWNPATDLQAMARVHRDGQKRPCYIYRLVTQGALDEKIFQRQVSKTGLADSIVDGKNGVSGFTREELKDLFTLDENEQCQTHQLLGCDCGGKGVPLNETEVEDDDSERNDLARLSSNNKEIERDENGIEILHMDGDDEDVRVVPKKSQWKKGTEYDWQAEEAELQRQNKTCRDSSGKVKMKSLMQYAHFDTALVESYVKEEPTANADEEDVDEVAQTADPLEGVIEDAILRCVIREDGRRVGFVFSKMSG